MDDYAYTLGCGATCDSVGPVCAQPEERDEFDTSHAHDSAPYVYRMTHPSRDADDAVPEFEARQQVTFHGSTTGAVAGFVKATVVRSATSVTTEGDSVDGYIVATEHEHRLFVPASALAGEGSERWLAAPTIVGGGAPTAVDTDDVRDAIVETSPELSGLILARDQVVEKWCRDNDRDKNNLDFADVTVIRSLPEWINAG